MNKILLVKETEKKKIEDIYEKTNISSNELSCKIYDSGIILPNHETKWPPKGGVCDAKGVFVRDSTSWYCEDYIRKEDIIQEIKEDVVFIGSLVDIYGHTFTDNLTRIWWVLSHPYVKVAYTAFWTKKDAPEYVYKIFDLLGVDLKKGFCIKSPTRFNRVYLPEKAFERGLTNFGGANMQMLHVYNKMIESALKNTILKETDVPKRIYLSRTKWNSNGWISNGFRDIGEEKIEEAFLSNGYKVIHPEEHSITDQIAMFYYCDEIATTEGSIAHNCIFMKPKKNIVIIRKANYVNKYQITINKLRNLNAVFIDAHKSKIVDESHPAEGPFYMCITPFLEIFFGHKIIHCPTILRPSYWFYYFLRSNKTLIRFVRTPFIQKLKNKKTL